MRVSFHRPKRPLKNSFVFPICCSISLLECLAPACQSSLVSADAVVQEDELV